MNILSATPHTHTHTHTHTHARTHTHTHSLAHTVSHTHTHSLTHTLSLSLFPPRRRSILFCDPPNSVTHQLSLTNCHTAIAPVCERDAIIRRTTPRSCGRIRPPLLNASDMSLLRSHGAKQTGKQMTKVQCEQGRNAAPPNNDNDNQNKKTTHQQCKTHALSSACLREEERAARHVSLTAATGVC